MNLIYNGIKLELAQINQIARTAIYDESGVDYLYTEWMIDVVCIYNRDGGTIGFRDNSVPSYGGNPSSTLTDIALRFKLMQPRKSLTLDFASKPEEAGGSSVDVYERILQVPPPGSACDVNNGPIPLHCVVTEVVGEGTLAVQYVIKCHTNECNGPSDGTVPEKDSPFVLSNRFTMSHNITEDHYTIRQIDGIVHFRADLLNQLNNSGILNAQLGDEFRESFTFPVPKNFQRVGVSCTQSPDGTAIYYQIVDKELPTNLNNYGTNAVKVEMTHSQSLTSDGNILNGVITGLNAYYNFRWTKKAAKDDDPHTEDKKPDPLAGMTRGPN